MKKGQNRTYAKECFQTGLTEHGELAAQNRAKIWWSGNSQDKKDRMNIIRKSKKNKRK